MKNDRSLVLSVLLVFILLSFSSCTSGELSRETAEQVIKEKFQNDEIREFVVDGNYSSLLEFKYKELQNEGVITYFEKSMNLYEIQFTEKGKPYIFSEERFNCGNFGHTCQKVKVAKLVFSEITGILQEKGSNSAKVEYTVIRKDITPFGKLCFNLSEVSFQDSVNFFKYDDGWRIKE